MIEVFDLGDIVEMKKQHPCGSKEFEVIRLGADIKILEVIENELGEPEVVYSLPYENLHD